MSRRTAYVQSNELELVHSFSDSAVCADNNVACQNGGTCEIRGNIPACDCVPGNERVCDVI